MAKPSELEPVNSVTLAACFGMSERRVQQLAKEGVIPYFKQGKSFRYNLIEAVSKYTAYLRDGAQSDAALDFEERKAKAEAELKENKLEQERLKLAELEGTMHRSDDVREATESLVYSVRGQLVALPGRLAVDVTACKSAAEASEVIRREVNRILDDLTKYRYDPAFYASQVRDRQGWREMTDEEPCGES